MPPPSSKFLIDFASLEPYECCALVVTLLAQPDKREDDEAMGGLFATLCHLALQARAETDETWASSPQRLKPIYAFREPQDINRDLKQVKRRLRDRMVAAKMVMGFLKEAETKQAFVLPKGMKRLSLNCLAEWVLDDLDIKVEDNVETRIWRPSLPVIHIAAAIAVLMDQAERAGHVPFTIGHLLLNPGLIRLVIERSNQYADLLLKSTKLKLDPDTLIRLEAIG